MSEKRYNLVVPQEKWNEIYNIALRENLPVSVVLRRFIDLGLIASSPNSQLFLSHGGEQKRLRVFPNKDNDEYSLY